MIPKRSVKNEPGVWYRFDGEVCVLCGRETVERTRMAPPKPERWEDRYDIRDGACGGHFL